MSDQENHKRVRNPFLTNNKRKGIFLKPGLAVFMLLFFVLSVTAGASDTGQADRPRIGLVLGGGGARGAAHIGVIKILEELRIPIDVIAGTSMGSIVGGLYASGMGPDELETAITNIDWNDAFRDASPREKRSFRDKHDDLNFMVKSSPGFRDGELLLPQGLIQGQKLNFILKSLTIPVAKTENFDELSIPYRAVTTNIETGEVVVIGSGDLANAMRASMSVPGVFSPIRIDGRLLVDGGVANNLPVDIARGMGADVVIAVNVGTPLMPGHKIKSVLNITDQLTRLMTHSNVKAQIEALGPNDILIQPELGDLGSADFGRSAEGIAIGEKAAANLRQRLQSLSLSQSEYDAYLTEREKRSVHDPITIDFIRVVNNSRLSDEVIASRIHAKLGKEPDLSALKEDIGAIYALDIFENVDYNLVTEKEKTGLLVNAIGKSWGPNYLQFGIRLADDLQGENSYDLGISYTMTELNRLGGEWRTEVTVGKNPRFFTEFYQPLDHSLRYFLSPYVEYENRNVNLFRSGDLVSQYRVSTSTIGLEGGRELGDWGELKFGIRRVMGKAEVRIGPPYAEEFDFDDGDIFARFSYDTLDSLNFPRHGAKAAVEWAFFREELGADISFNRLVFIEGTAHTLDKNTLIMHLKGATVFDDEVSIQHNFPLGGFLNLSGYHEKEIYGPHSLSGAMIYYRQIGDITYLGCSLETGNVWEDTDDIDFGSLIPAGSVFLGVDSFLGPLYLGFGYAEGGRNSVYLYLGKGF
ncbi:patatin-like phospholipase family protein [Desulfobacterales bacterium HSG2]|nr:patatin-like phospholipase family protein [Desulfobacterales bacterium HSG2]